MTHDVYGQALLDYFNGKHRARIHTVSSLGDRDTIPVSYYFRDRAAMPPLERKALDLCRGRILDVGCGAGCHGLWLQHKGFDYTGVDLSPGAVATCRLRGLGNVHQGDIRTWTGGPYDTILLLMNGLGLSGSAVSLEGFLKLLLRMLDRGGQILAESTDLQYLFDLLPELRDRRTPDETYYGNLVYEMEYNGKKSEPFPWLFAEADLAVQAAEKAGARAEILSQVTNSGYLLRITH